jgi:hypothetical protein
MIIQGNRSYPYSNLRLEIDQEAYCPDLTLPAIHPSSICGVAMMPLRLFPPGLLMHPLPNQHPRADKHTGCVMAL